MKTITVRKITTSLIDKAIQAGIKNWMLAIKADAQFNAHSAGGSDYARDPMGYYEDGRIPYWRGTLANSIEIRDSPDGMGAEIVATAPYADQIEHGGVIKKTPELVQWVLAKIKNEDGSPLSEWQAERISIKLDGRELKAHPFLLPAVKRNIDSFPPLFIGGFLAYLQTHGGGR